MDKKVYPILRHTQMAQMVHGSDFWPPCCRWNLVSNFPTTRGIPLAPRGPCREHQECSALHCEFIDRWPGRRDDLEKPDAMATSYKSTKPVRLFLTVESLRVLILALWPSSRISRHHRSTQWCCSWDTGQSTPDALVQVYRHPNAPQGGSGDQAAWGVGVARSYPRETWAIWWFDDNDTENDTWSDDNGNENNDD